MNLVQCRSFIIRRWKTTEESSSYTVSACELKLFHYQESLLHLRSLDTFLCQTTSHHPSLYHPSSLSPTSIPHRSNPTHWWIRYIQLRTHHNRRAEYSSGDSFAFGYPEVSEHSPTIQLATICGWTDAYTLGWLNRRIHSGSGWTDAYTRGLISLLWSTKRSSMWGRFALVGSFNWRSASTHRPVVFFCDWPAYALCYGQFRSFTYISWPLSWELSSSVLESGLELLDLSSSQFRRPLRLFNSMVLTLMPVERATDFIQTIDYITLYEDLVIFYI